MGDIISSKSLGKSKTVRVNIYESGAVYLYTDPDRPGKLLAPKTLYELADVLVDAAEMSEALLKDHLAKKKEDRKLRPIVAIKAAQKKLKDGLNSERHVK